MDDFKNEYDDSTNVIVEINKNVEDTLYDEDKGAFYKLSSKKEIKYSCFDITFYILYQTINWWANNQSLRP